MWRSNTAGQSAASTIPVVFHTSSDPVAIGLVASLARPGGNLTGVSLMGGELIPKLLELLLELVPQARLIALLRDPSSPLDVQEVADARGVRLHILKAITESEIDSAFASLVQLQAGGLIVYTGNRPHIAALASRHAVPAISLWRDFPEIGGLLSYGPSQTAAYRVKGIYAGRILKGTKAADLPVQQPTTFELVVNLKTAKELGLTVPPSTLARADEVIE
jgi:putative tryptophan/tyrosine transport system substrate-binding protein